MFRSALGLSTGFGARCEIQAGCYFLGHPERMFGQLQAIYLDLQFYYLIRPSCNIKYQTFTCIGANYTLGISAEVFTGFAGEGTLLLVLTGFPKPVFITETLSTFAYPMICSGHIYRLQLLIDLSNMQSRYRTTP